MIFFLNSGQILFNLTYTFVVHHEKSFVPAFHLFDNLESGKKKLLFWKKSGKSLELDPKICTNPAHSVSKFNPLDKDTLLMWRLRGPLESVHSNVHFYQLT